MFALAEFMVDIAAGESSSVHQLAFQALSETTTKTRQKTNSRHSFTLSSAAAGY
jgi:hypothetical protein